MNPTSNLLGARGVGCGLIAAFLLALQPADAEAQGYRGWIGSSVQVVELRPLGLDTVPRSEVIDVGNGSLQYLGRAASCFSQEFCSIYATLDESRTLSATQDASVTAWGFGVEGLSVTALVRARARAGSDVVWPRSDDEFDALLAYAQWLRGPLRVRAGRQELYTGLGFPAFDGAWAAYARAGTQIELYAGRSLARGLREPANEALRGLEDFVPDKGVALVGVSGQARFGNASVTARYHREILTDRSSLVSERASLDFTTAIPGARFAGSLDYDFGFQRVGKGHLTATLPLAEGRWLIELSGRRYLPYFELSTIWGFFEPVSYSELEARGSWSPGPTLGVWASGGWRRYEDSGATTVLRPLDDTGWRASAGTRWQMALGWTLEGDYRLEWGPGGFLNSADASVRRELNAAMSVRVSASTFQQIEEFRIGDGRAFGGGASVDWNVGSRVNWSGGLSILRHRGADSTLESPWNQARGWAALRIEVGDDPGLRNRSRR